jgi:hypothetical protein
MMTLSGKIRNWQPSALRTTARAPVSASACDAVTKHFTYQYAANHPLPRHVTTSVYRINKRILIPLTGVIASLPFDCFGNGWPAQFRL